MDEEFICCFCFQPNSIFIDPSGGSSQKYVEDCQVCCRPNILTIWWDDNQDMFMVESYPES